MLNFLRRFFQKKKVTKTYAFYNGVPLCKTWDGDKCISVRSSDEKEIVKHNQSPLPCDGVHCKVCEPNYDPRNN